MSRAFQKKNEKGEANGYASLDGTGKVPSAQLPAASGTPAWGDITGTLANQTDLDSALSGKAASSHTHDYAASSHTHDYSASGHNHDASYSALGHSHDYAASGHNHAGVYEPANANIQTHVGSAHAPSNAQKNSDITKAEIEAKLTGELTSHSHSGGSDPWTYVVLGSDFTISTTANNVVTGLAFAPSANAQYHIEGYYLLRTATATTGARPGIAWPGGYADGASYTQAPNSATALAMQNGNPVTGTANAASTGLPVINRSYAGQMQAILIMGASPTGNFQVTLASETGAVNVTMKAGSFIRYRTYA